MARRMADVMFVTLGAIASNIKVNIDCDRMCHNNKITPVITARWFTSCLVDGMVGNLNLLILWLRSLWPLCLPAPASTTSPLGRFVHYMREDKLSSSGLAFPSGSNERFIIRLSYSFSTATWASGVTPVIT